MRGSQNPGHDPASDAAPSPVESRSNPSRPLRGIRLVEFAGLGPTPFAAMMLADMGAEIIRIERAWPPRDLPGDPGFDFLRRGRPAIVVDLKSPEGRAHAIELIGAADILLEGYRPGVMERLGLGPDAMTALRPQLIYARMTGWGQHGPLAHRAGHDINYLAMTGGLEMIGDADRAPPPPINFLGDYGGGAMFVVAGILAALIERHSSGKGQVVDAAMIDGTSMLMTQIFAWSAMGAWRPERGSNLLDGGAYFYRCYETSDGRYIAVGALEPQFHDALLTGLGLDPADFPDRTNSVHWAERGARLAAIFRTATRDEWIERLSPYDACVSPVLSAAEAVTHPANTARNVHEVTPLGVQPAPAPRLSRTPFQLSEMPGEPGPEARPRLLEWGFSPDLVDRIVSA